MIVEIRDLVGDTIETLVEEASPYEVRITIMGTIYRLSYADGLLVRTNKPMRISPMATNTVVLRGND